MSSQQPILIAGAGLSSLLLARSLLRSHIPFQIFERDASLSFRGQGYRLRLSTEGLDAIEDVLGPDEFGRFYDICGKTGGSGFTALNAITGEQVEHKVPEKLGSRDGLTIGIARGEMRKFFLEGSEDFVQFNKNVVDYEESPNGVKVIFGDGSRSVEGSMLIIGDGLKSKVSKKLSEGKIKHYDTLVRGIHGQAPTLAFKGLEEGVYRFVDDSRGEEGNVSVITNIRSKDMDDPSIQFGWTMVGSPGLIKAPNDDYTIIGKTAADIAKSLTANWSPKLKPLFTEMVENEAAFWKITCSTPSGVPVWKNHPRITVIGDAVHSMTPAGGIGANTAVRDSALLGRLLGEAGGYREGITKEYEDKMRVYASEAVATSYGLAEKQFGIRIDEETSPTV
ncbi:hypothetical protein I302_100411 [Kwoniella bestiolae CBS 10118]|uniref:FAD-binding domain-containing protein n=1 Tax=Kwoniella bestiolae CBS 10118 TaxID=1296100 RepID=A0A1B9G4Z9_9TREE|nr:hypothetical protein I302_03786 [Kwoniella bestiolae CBS 10118]OCF26109.1 hypothetical protein I302_03786 [Kwoniella bestiolae CBS 10118]